MTTPEIPDYRTAEEKRVADRFPRDVEKHEMTVLHEDGLYRHVRFQQPGTSIYYFDLITWPGSLAIKGDMDGFMFSRIDDMFAFFRMDGYRVNPTYWSEKIAGHRNSVMSYSEDVFKTQIFSYLDDVARDEPERAEDVETARKRVQEAIDDGDAAYEESVRELLRELEEEGVVSDSWEWDLRDWDYRFLWNCHAIAWGLQQYDAAKKAA
ncbi:MULTISPECIES: hypothetical protein [Catenuloplanes]|uniref:Uncharacterized protein n=1 Tax=Catenuloplanes niger TaxID=587534 RepID=A0AAE3ZPY1_9ACTN|nr:hypothetical protein [Catenuloplanes niger]MDR7323401.1 hypothetical protein [Catenuloplanes niger]